jgi:hypothetical protein
MRWSSLLWLGVPPALALAVAHAVAQDAAPTAPAPHPAEAASPPACLPPVAWYAQPLVPCHYTGYYVGGGCVFHGRGPGPEEGTWGWDYEGHGCFWRYVWLKWCPCRYQGGIGAYRSEVHVPNVFGIKLHHKEADCEE